MNICSLDMDNSDQFGYLNLFKQERDKKIVYELKQKKLNQIVMCIL